MLCREDHQVGAQQADKRGEKCTAACLFCVLDIFSHRAVQTFAVTRPRTCFLLRQKGQHLEPFIQSFFNSCESPKPKPSRPELTILSPTSENEKKVSPLLLKCC